MGKSAAASSRVYVDEFAISGDIQSWDMGLDQETPVVTGLSDAGPRRLVGNYDCKLSHNGLLEATDNLSDEQLFLLLQDGADHYWGVVPEGSGAENSVAYEFIGHVEGEPRSAQVGNAIMLNVSAVGNNGLSRGLVLASLTSTGAGNRTGRNMGATTSGQIFRVVFRVLSFSGTSITMKIQESSDDGGGDAYADVSGLTSGAISAPDIVVVTTTAATEAYKRVNIAGTHSSALVLVTAGLVEV